MIEQISRRSGRTHVMALSLKQALEKGGEVAVLTKDPKPDDIVKRLLNLGVKVIAKPIMSGKSFGHIGRYDGVESKQIGFKLTLE